MQIPANSKLLFIGDSITDAGRSEGGEVTPWSPMVGLGSGYVNLINALIEAERPDLKIRIINRGLSGNTILDLENRWKSDVLDYEPDWLSVMIGINDVWRQFDTPLKRETHVDPERYEKTLRKLLNETKPRLSGLILMSPFIIESHKGDAMRELMDAYGVIVKAVAEEFGAVFVDTQAAFDRVLEHRHPASLAWDRIHPGTAGHMVIAREFLKQVKLN